MKPLGVRGYSLAVHYMSISIICRLDPIRYSCDVEDWCMWSTDSRAYAEGVVSDVYSWLDANIPIHFST